MSDNREKTGPSRKGKVTLVISIYGVTLFLLGLAIWHWSLHRFAAEYPNIFTLIVGGTWLFAFVAFEENCLGFKLKNKCHDELVELNAIRREYRTLANEIGRRAETGKIQQKNFRYLLDKISSVLGWLQNSTIIKPDRIIYVSPLDDGTLQEAKNLAALANQYTVPLEWYITERTPTGVGLREELERFTAPPNRVYLTGELPLLDKMIVVPNGILVGFCGDTWLSWDLTDLNLSLHDIKEKIVMTPFSKKISQFMGNGDVHSAISCHLSKIVNKEGFMIDAEHSYLWIVRPEELFSEFTKYQEKINQKFEEVSDELRTISANITANLPLLGNYKSIINDKKIREWLGELQDEACRKPQLQVDRYIYIDGQYNREQWHITDPYRKEIADFLQESFFSRLPINYHLRLVLLDSYLLNQLYTTFLNSFQPAVFPNKIATNWIWFECERWGTMYHVLQYEEAMNVEQQLAAALAPMMGKEESELKALSIFKFADAIEPTSQDVMAQYLKFRQFLKSIEKTQVVLERDDFLRKYGTTNGKPTNP